MERGVKKILILVLLFTLSACKPAEVTEAPASSVEDAIAQLLADNLDLDTSAVSVKSNHEVEFNDACMDVVAFSDVTCAQVVTPGRVVVLEAHGIEYEYHTTPEGDVIHPVTLALTWTREGGIAGFCDRLVVFLSGEIYATNCKSQPAEAAGTFAEFLSASEMSQFNTWFTRFGEVDLDVSDPVGVADGMKNTLVFYGDGTGKPGKADQQSLLEWAQSLYAKLSS
jgi:hypothetical protein